MIPSLEPQPMVDLKGQRVTKLVKGLNKINSTTHGKYRNIEYKKKKKFPTCLLRTGYYRYTQLIG